MFLLQGETHPASFGSNEIYLCVVLTQKPLSTIQKSQMISTSSNSTDDPMKEAGRRNDSIFSRLELS